MVLVCPDPPRTQPEPSSVPRYSKDGSILSVIFGESEEVKTLSSTFRSGCTPAHEEVIRTREIAAALKHICGYPCN